MAQLEALSKSALAAELSKAKSFSGIALLHHIWRTQRHDNRANACFSTPHRAAAALACMFSSHQRFRVVRAFPILPASTSSTVAGRQTADARGVAMRIRPAVVS